MGFFGDPLYTPEYEVTGDEVAVFDTSKGKIRVRLDGTGAPITLGRPFSFAADLGAFVDPDGTPLTYTARLADLQWHAIHRHAARQCPRGAGHPADGIGWRVQRGGCFPPDPCAPRADHRHGWQ